MPLTDFRVGMAVKSLITDTRFENLSCKGEAFGAVVSLCGGVVSVSLYCSCMRKGYTEHNRCIPRLNRVVGLFSSQCEIMDRETYLAQARVHNGFTVPKRESV